jgi:DNA-binding PadR family transcriptional regulator
MRAEVLRGHLETLLLSVLSERALHGYAIAEALKEESGGALDLPEGTIYPALHRLEEAGALSSRWSSVSGRRRRVYSLTSSGRRTLMNERLEWAAFSQMVTAVLGRKPWATRT